MYFTCFDARSRHSLVYTIGFVAVMLARQLHVSKVGQSKEKGKDQASDTYK